MSDNIIGSLRKPVSVFWEPTEFCNLQCKHCYTNSGPQKKTLLGFREAKKIVDDLYEEGIYAIGMGGGEPLLLPYLLDLIKYINTKNMNISISTNATLLTDEYIAKLKEAGLKILQISVDGLEETHETIRGKGTFKGLFDKIRKVQAVGIGVRIGFTVNTLNYKEIDDFIDFAKANNVHVINFFRYMPYHENGEYLALSAEQLYETTKTLIRRRKENCYGDGEDKFYITFEPLSFFSFLLDENDINETVCTAGRSKFVISCDGSVSMCNYISRKIGNISDGLNSIWDKVTEEYRKIHFDIPKDCKMCRFAEKCRGGCKGFSYIYSENFLTKDKGCYYHLLDGGI